MKTPSALSRATGGLALLALALTGCATADENTPGAPASPAAAASAPAQAGWPRTVAVGDREVAIEQEPASIVAVTSEAADLVLLLAGPERVAAVAAGSQSPHSGTAVELALQVADTLPPGTDPDPEQILSLAPDLVVSTARHGGEKAAAEQLQATGVPTVNLDSAAFATPEGIAETITTLGDMLGEEERAASLRIEFEERIAELDAQHLHDGPATLALMARGRNVMAMDDSLMLPHLVERAGGTNAASAIGITQTRPVDAEVILHANPDVIILEDFQGLGRAPFEELLSNPALADVPAVAAGRVHLVPMTDASGISGVRTPVGYRTVIDILSEVG
ncbi:ABC transporter substrate-binding protein [Tessaracoccus terricola]